MINIRNLDREDPSKKRRRDILQIGLDPIDPNNAHNEALLRSSAYSIFPSSDPDFVYWNGIFQAVNVLQNPLAKKVIGDPTNQINFQELRSDPILDQMEKFKFRIMRFEFPSSSIPYFISNPAISSISLPPGKTGLIISLNVTVIPNLNTVGNPIRYFGSFGHNITLNELSALENEICAPNEKYAFQNIHALISALNTLLLRALTNFFANAAFQAAVDPALLVYLLANIPFRIPYFSFDTTNGFVLRVPGDIFWTNPRFDPSSVGAQFTGTSPTRYLVPDGANPVYNGIPLFSITVSDSLRDILRCLPYSNNFTVQAGLVFEDVVVAIPVGGSTWGPFTPFNPGNVIAPDETPNLIATFPGDISSLSVLNAPQPQFIQVRPKMNWYPIAIRSIRLKAAQMPCPSESVQSLQNRNNTSSMVTDFVVASTLEQLSGDQLIYNENGNGRWIDITSNNKLTQPAFTVDMVDEVGESYPYCVSFSEVATMKVQFEVKQPTLRI